MKLFDGQSREKICTRDYRWGQLSLALVPGFLFHLLCTVVGWTLREKVEGELKTSDSAPIVVVYHREFPITLSAQRTWKKLFKGVGYLGIHNWISYCTSVLCYLDGLPAVRYDRRTGLKPLNQVLDFLRQNRPLPFAIRTDSGGPYNRVRSSVVRMALEANRPIVCVRQTSDHTVRIFDHFFPLPFSHVVTRVSDPIVPQALSHLTMEDATARVQFVMDYLAESDAVRAQLVSV